MSKTKILSLFKRATFTALAAGFVLANTPFIASAAPITGRTVTIGSSVASASTTYAFTFTVPTTGTAIKSASFAACTTASGSCTMPTGFNTPSNVSTLTGQPTGMGSGSGWTVNTATQGELRLSNASNITNPSGSQAVSFSGVINPSAVNSTFYLRITTYSAADWTSAIDTGTVAASTAGQITVTASVDETLTFTLGSATVALGTISSTSTGSGTSTMTVGTNAASGYSVAYNAAPTLTSGSSTITAMSGAASSQGSKQFGINLRDNTTPNVGTDISGSGSGAIDANYNTVDNFRFNTAGDTVASASAATNDNVYTVSYIANVTTDTAAGAYSTALTYVATANF